MQLKCYLFQRTEDLMQVKTTEWSPELVPDWQAARASASTIRSLFKRGCSRRCLTLQSRFTAGWY